MSRPGGILLLFVSLLAGGCPQSQPCRDGTLFVDLTLAGGAGAADRLSVTLQLDGQRFNDDDVIYAGQSSYGLEVQFPSGYPTGQTVIVTVAARQGDVALASAMVTVRFDAACVRLPLTLSTPVAGDLSGGAGDLSAAAADLLPATGDLSAAATDLLPGDALGEAPSPDLTPPISLCPQQPDLLLCDNFDEPALDGWGSIGNTSIDTTHVYHGTGAFHGRVVHNAAVAASEKHPYLWPTDLYMRVFVLLPVAPPVEVTILRMQNNASDVDLLVTPSGFATTATSADEQTVPAAIPVNTWFCVVWHIHQGDATSGLSEVSLNGAKLGFPNKMETQADTPPYTDLYVGPQVSDVSNPYDVYLDELLVDDQPLTCAQANPPAQ
jgi:hypothetical protein